MCGGVLCVMCGRACLCVLCMCMCAHACTLVPVPLLESWIGKQARLKQYYSRHLGSGWTQSPTEDAIMHLAMQQQECLPHTRSHGRLSNLARLESKMHTSNVAVRNLLFADSAAIITQSPVVLQNLINRFSQLFKEILIRGYGAGVWHKQTVFVSIRGLYGFYLNEKFNVK